jgi:hypothetical protein
VPQHKCHKSSAERYGLSSGFRYILKFRTLRDEIVEIDDTCVLLDYSEFHLMIPTVKSIYEQLERIEIKTTIMQLMYQDPMFYDSFGALQAFDKVEKMGTYVLYLYLKFHLLPYVKVINAEDLEGKLNPVPIVVLSTKEEVNIDLLGYDRNEEVEQTPML